MLGSIEGLDVSLDLLLEAGAVILRGKAINSENTIIVKLKVICEYDSNRYRECSVDQVDILWQVAQQTGWQGPSALSQLSTTFAAL